MSTWVRAAMAGVVSVGFAGISSAQSSRVLEQRQFITQFSCADARNIETDAGKAGTLSADGRREVEIVWAACAADQHNQDRPDQRQVVLVAPSASAPASENKTYVATVRVADGEGVREFCEKAGSTVAGAGGPVSCETFVRSAKASLLVLVPASVGGTAVTTRLLALVGSGDPDGHLQSEVQRVAKATRGLADGGAVADHPIVLVASTGGVGTLSGTGGQLAHHSKCLFTMGFGAGCPNR